MNSCECGGEFKFDHTDYYDFDVYKCNKCGRQYSLAEGDYSAGAFNDYEDEFDDDYEDEDGAYRCIECGRIIVGITPIVNVCISCMEREVNDELPDLR